MESFSTLKTAHSSSPGPPASTGSGLRNSISSHTLPSPRADTIRTSNQEGADSHPPAHTVGTHGSDCPHPPASPSRAAHPPTPSPSKGKKRKIEHHDYISSESSSASTQASTSFPTSLVVRNAPLGVAQTTSNSEGQNPETRSAENRPLEVITRLAATSLDMESTRHRIGCHLVQLFDMVEELVNLDKTKQYLTSEFWANGLDMHSGLHLMQTLRYQRMAAGSAFPRLPASPSLSLYSDEDLRKLGDDFSVNPASVGPVIERFGRNDFCVQY